MSMLERRQVFKVCGQGTSARRSSRYSRAAHRQRAGAGRIVRKTARRAGITKPVSHAPHAATRVHHRQLDAGVPLRDVQEAASHADPRTTMRYDRAAAAWIRHATYRDQAAPDRGACR